MLKLILCSMCTKNTTINGSTHEPIWITQADDKTHRKQRAQLFQS